MNDLKSSSISVIFVPALKSIAYNLLVADLNNNKSKFSYNTLKILR